MEDLEEVSDYNNLYDYTKLLMYSIRSHQPKGGS